jgi:ATP-binding cassette, subfamily C, bacterial CydD
MQKSVPRLNEADNQQYFDQHQAREKHCTHWLKNQSQTIKKPIRLAAVFGILHGVLIIGQMMILAEVLSSLVLQQAELSSLYQPLASLAALLVLRAVLQYQQQAIGFQASVTIREQLRQQLLTAYANPSLLKQHHSGALSSISLEQVNAIAPYFSRYLPQQLIVSVLPLMMLAVVFSQNWLVGLILLITAPLIPIFMILAGMGANAAQAEQFLALSRMSGYFLDRLQGLPTLKLFGLANAELTKVQAVAKNFRISTMRVLHIAFLSSAVLEFFSALAVALVAVYVGLSLLGKLSYAPAIDFKTGLFVLLIAPEFFQPLRQLAVFYHDKSAALTAADNILNILESDAVGWVAPATQHKIQTTALIELKNIHKTYDDRAVLTDINLNIQQGEKIALVGTSGAGKTTLLNILLGFETATTGEIYLNGEALNRERATENMTYVGQNAYLFYGTIYDNIALANTQATEQQVYAAAQAAGVTEFSNALPDGLQTIVGERGYGLSGGQAQRIALARAFLKNTDIILLDEPTAHLDADTKTRLIAMIMELFKDKTLIIATHDEAVMQCMKRCVELQQGRLV